MTDPQQVRLPPWAESRIEQLAYQLRGPAVALKLWEELLNTDERQSLGNDLNEQYYKLRGSVGIWMKLRGVSWAYAIVDLADRLWGLPYDERRRLLEAAGEKTHCTREPPNLGIPCWNRHRGQLLWKGRQIRRHVRCFASPSNIELILNAFEQQNWPVRIEDPLPRGPDPQRLHQAVFTLNQTLKAIRFHAREGGTAVSWSVSSPRRRRAVSSPERRR